MSVELQSRAVGQFWLGENERRIGAFFSPVLNPVYAAGMVENKLQ
jgi:hypothetical protein